MEAAGPASGTATAVEAARAASGTPVAAEAVPAVSSKAAALVSTASAEARSSVKTASVEVTSIVTTPIAASIVAATVVSAAPIEAMEPWASADKDAARKIVRAVVAVRRTIIRVIAVVPILADRRRITVSRANSNAYNHSLCMRRKCGRKHANSQ
jgi:hypothetical protein